MILDVGGLAVGVDEAGAGAAVVFIHGFPFHRGMWARELRVASGAGWRGVAYDLRGFGESASGDGPCMLETYVDDLAALLDRLGLARAVLCGLSMGGYIALRAAEREPGRVGGLVLCDTRSEPDTDEARLGRASALKAAAADRARFAEGLLAKLFPAAALAARTPAVEQVREMILEAPLAGLRAALVAMAARTDTTPSLPRIAAPTLVVVGEADALTPPAVGEGLARRIPGARLAVLPGAGHVSNLDAPEAFGAALASFLSGVGRP